MYLTAPKFGGGGPVQLTTGGRLTVTNTSVQISSTVWGDSGTYQCKANNSLEPPAQANGYLTVYSKYTTLCLLLYCVLNGCL